MQKIQNTIIIYYFSAILPFKGWNIKFSISEEDLFGDYWQKHLLPNSKTITNYVNKSASETPDKTYLIEADTDSFISYKKLKGDILKLGSFFEQNNIKAGDKVGFLLDNSYATTLLFLGSMYHLSLIHIWRCRRRLRCRSRWSPYH